MPVSIEIKDETLTMTTERPVAYMKGERFMLIDMNAKTVHLIGSGTAV